MRPVAKRARDLTYPNLCCLFQFRGALAGNPNRNIDRRSCCRELVLVNGAANAVIVCRKADELNPDDIQASSPENERAPVVVQDQERDDADRHGQKRGWGDVCLLLAVLLPAVVAFSVLYRQRLLVPYHDDYGVILTFANEYGRLHGFTAKLLDIATTQSNDYKLGVVHFVIAMQLELTGHLNFAFLVTLGNSCLLAIASLLWRVYRRDGITFNQQLLEFLPITFLFFSLTYWETMNWAMAGLQNLSVILFSLLAIYLLVPKGANSLSFPILLVACISAALAAFSSANGFLLAPVGLLLLLRRRAFVASVVWCVSFVLPIAAYRYHYVPFHVSVDTMYRGSFLGKICYFFAFLGCAIQERWLAAILGFVVFMVLILAARSGFERTNPVPFYFSTWILLTAVPVAWLRHGIASRYSIYSLLLLIFCYWFLAQYFCTRSAAFNRTRFYGVSISLAAVLCFASDTLAYVHLEERRQIVLSGLENYRANPVINSPLIDSEIKTADPKEEEFERATLTRAIAEHLYTLPADD
jgi:hypothetical protein